MKSKSISFWAVAGLAMLTPLALSAEPDDGDEQAQTDEQSLTDDAEAVDSAAETAGAETEAPGPEDAALAEEGASLFGQRCGGCHVAESGQRSFGGPNLAGVVGRQAGSGQFRYSTAMRNSGLTWNAEELDSYLTSPMAKVPGTSMTISLPDAGQRAAVIAFLATKPASEE
jgi:cytochrome c